MTIISMETIKQLDRGGGVVSIPLITKHSDPTARITTGISIYPKGSGAPRHLHNCDEQVTLLEGDAEVDIEGQATRLRPYDTTYITAGREHAFRNLGNSPMKILWIYPTQMVTRTLMETGETVEHLSAKDLMG
jgi:quercetin dioxygenase-like cupin family protein